MSFPHVRPQKVTLILLFILYLFSDTSRFYKRKEKKIQKTKKIKSALLYRFFERFWPDSSSLYSTTNIIPGCHSSKGSQMKATRWPEEPVVFRWLVALRSKESRTHTIILWQHVLPAHKMFLSFIIFLFFLKNLVIIISGVPIIVNHLILFLVTVVSIENKRGRSCTLEDIPTPKNKRLYL